MPSVVPEGSYQMDHNTLWFIANGGVGQMGPGPAPRPYRPAPTSTPQGPDFKCEKDHSIRDCPLLREEKPKTSTVPPLVIHCADCGIKHFVQDCPVRPKGLGKVTLNFIETIPSTSAPSSSESEKIIPVKVITRAQAQAKQKDRDEKKETPSEKDVPSESSKSAKNSWKARRERRAASKKRKAEQSEKETKEKPEKTTNEKGKTNKETNPVYEKKREMRGEAGSVLAEKFFEPLMQC